MISSGSSDNISGTMAGNQTELSYYFTNNGTSNLTISNPTPTVLTVVNCTYTFFAVPSSPLPAGLQTLFQFEVTPTTAGTFTVSFSFTNNDANENPYTWTVTGNAAAFTASPELNVFVDGPNYWSNDVDMFLGAMAYGVPLELNVLLSNSGSATLNMGLITVNAYLNMTSGAVTSPPSAAIAASQQSACKIGYTIAAAGSFAMQITIPSDDGDENPFRFIVYGNGAVAPEIKVVRGGNDVFSFSGDNYGSPTAGTAASFSYTITNSGTTTLSLGAPSITAQNNCTALITAAPSTSVAPSGTTTITISVTPTVAGAFDFGFSFTTNDTNESPYTIYPYGIAVAGTTPPPSGSSGDGGGGGCSTDETPTATVCLLVLLAVLAVSCRRRALPG